MPPRKTTTTTTTTYYEDEPRKRTRGTGYAYSSSTVDGGSGAAGAGGGGWSSLWEERPRAVTVCVTFFWILFMVLAWILLLVSVVIPDWLEGTEERLVGNQVVLVTREVGLFRQCISTSVTSGEDCFDVPPSDIYSSVWKAAAAFFILGFIVLAVAIILAIVSFCVVILIPWAKTVMSVASVCFMIAVVLMPIGYAFLDDSCEDGDFLNAISNQRAQCELLCDDPSDDMNYFALCSPYSHGAAAWLMFVGMILLFIASFIAATLRVALVKYEVNE